MIERLREILLGSPRLSPGDFQRLLELRAADAEVKAEWLEKEAATRKRIAKARLRARKAEREMGRSYGRVLKLVIVVVVVIVVLFLMVKSC